MDHNETPSSGDTFFVSYSRSEMYYAEGITLGLQRAGLNIWFDLQQLEPGCIWLEEIERGLNQADQMIVIVSRRSIQSPWVVKEWAYALEKGIPVHLILFEAVEFGEFEMIDPQGEAVHVDTHQLLDNAANIVDGRASLDRAKDRLLFALQEGKLVRDSIPIPNALGIPSRLPLSLVFVAASMLVLTAFLAWVAVLSIDIFLPTTIVSAILTVLAAQETGNFIQRESFRGTRVSLLAAAVLTPFLFPPVAVVFVPAALLAIFSLDVNRWAPRGEGARRGVSNSGLFGEAQQAALSLLRWYLSRALLWQWLVAGVLYLISFVMIRLLTNAPIEDVSPIAAVPSGGLFFLSIIERFGKGLFRRRDGNATSVDLPWSLRKSFRVIHDFSDSNVANLIAQHMGGAGHERNFKADQPADYYIVIVSSRLSPIAYAPYLDLPGHWIILLVGNLSAKDAARFSDLQDFQWVDYRKQNPQQLQVMVEELQIGQFDVVSHSFSTRTTPQSFEKLVLPWTVQVYLLAQVLFLILNAFVLSITLLEGSLFGSIGIDIALGVGSIYTGIVIITRVIQQAISVTTILNINIGFGVLSYMVGLVSTLLQPLPRGATLNFGTLFGNIVAFAIGVVIGYYINRQILDWMLGRWLPVEFNDLNLFSFSWQSEAWIYLRSALIVMIVFLVALTIIGVPETVSGINEPAPFRLLLSEMERFR